MVVVTELEQENQEIVALASILAVLVEKPEFRNNPVFCELLHRFMDRIEEHLSHEARSVYNELLAHQETNEAATRFISNAHELEKILGGYTKRWCVPIPSIEHHDRFVEETREIFRLLNERIAMESKHLFPVLNKSRGQQAAT